MDSKKKHIDYSGLSRLEKSLKATRLLCIMAIFAFLSFSIVDLFMVDHSVLHLYAVRLVLVCSSSFIYWASGLKSMRIHAYKTGALICISTGVGVVILTEMSGGSESPYWTMVMLVFFTTSLIMPFRPIQAGFVFTTIAVFFDVWMILNDAIGSSRSWAMSNAGIWLSLLVSVLAVVYIDALRNQEDADRKQLELLNNQLRSEITEREKAESDLRRTQQLDAVGRLAAGVAHELNNVLLVISSSAELIQHKKSESNKYANRILESAHRGARLTSDMLLFARKGHLENQPFSLNEVVKNVAEMMGDTQLKVSRINTALSSQEPCISGDRQLISQALLNLCLNGMDAMVQPGVLTIKTVLYEKTVKITVSDTGKGMSNEEINRAFEPFFTTKAHGKGTGLGLSMVYGIIKDHAGTIKIMSEKGQGTSVLIELPTTKNLLSGSPTKNQFLSTTIKNANILLVDDDFLVRTLTKESLEHYGFIIFDAKNGAEALTLFSQKDMVFDVIILDMVMPVMNGKEAYKKIREKSLTQKVLLYSGNISNQYGGELNLSKILENPNTHYLQKPFRQIELFDAIGRLLQMES